MLYVCDTINIVMCTLHSTMKKNGIVWAFVFVLLISASEALLDDYIDDCCANGYWGVLCSKCYHACPLREKGLEKLKDVLESNIVGQEHAINVIVDALQSQDRTKPIVFHFAGDNGVGKTHTAKIVGKALFAVRNVATNLYKGMLYLRGNRFCNKEHSDAEHREEILRQVVTHLSRCPNAVIVFDEAELPSKNVMQVFEEILDGDELSYGGIDASTNSAIFILISDFGVEGVTEGMTLEKIEERIDQDTRETWTHSKQTSMVNYIVPFLPMNKTHVTHAVTYQVRNLIAGQAIHPPIFVTDTLGIAFEYITYSDITLERLVQKVFDYTVTSKVYQNRNYRGIEQVFEKIVTPQMTKMLSRNGKLHRNKHVKLVLYVDDDMTINYQVH